MITGSDMPSTTVTRVYAKCVHRSMVTIWDDHETANDSWFGGAENHQSGVEGDWDAAMLLCRLITSGCRSESLPCVGC